MASRSVVLTSRLAVPCSRSRHRGFSTSTPCMVNPLLNLSHFSASKEAQFFSKERRIPREEYHPHLQLIRSSEVDPFAPSPGASPTVIAALKRAGTGQTDMQTAYNLAISNLGQQVVMMRTEVAQAHTSLIRIHERYKREERNSFLVMLGSVALITFVFVETNALQELEEYAREVRAEWKGFDWEWLGNPPSYKSTTTYSATSIRPNGSASSVTFTPAETRPVPVEARSDQNLVERRPTQPFPEVRLSSPSPDRWALSRLFWASPNRPES